MCVCVCARVCVCVCVCVVIRRTARYVAASLTRLPLLASCLKSHLVHARSLGQAPAVVIVIVDGATVQASGATGSRVHTAVIGCRCCYRRRLQGNEG